MSRVNPFAARDVHPAILMTSPRAFSEDDVFADYTIATGNPTRWGMRAIAMELRAPSAAAEPSVGEQIRVIRHYLSLSVSDFARVAHIERPHVYAWIDGSSSPRRGNAARLQSLLRIAERWRTLHGAPLGVQLRDPLPSRKDSLLDILSGDLGEGDLDAVLELLARGARQREATSIRARMAAAGMPPRTEGENAVGLLRAVRARGKRR